MRTFIIITNAILFVIQILYSNVTSHLSGKTRVVLHTFSCVREGIESYGDRTGDCVVNHETNIYLPTILSYSVFRTDKFHHWNCTSR